MRRALRPLSLLALPTVALTLAACGTANKDSAPSFQGEKRQVAKVIDRLQSDGRRRDAGAICTDLLAPALVKKIEAAARASCSSVLKDALTDTDSFDLKVQRVDVAGDRAGVVVKSSAGKDSRIDRLDLQKVGAAWRIASLGSIS